MIHVLFETKHDALDFESRVRNEKVTMNSALNSLDIDSNVLSNILSSRISHRIFFEHYIPAESESPQDTISQIRDDLSVYVSSTALFKFQRIEATGVFGPEGKAVGAHLMHCKNHKSYKKYDNDESNRLALSMDLHAFFDGFNMSSGIKNLTLPAISIDYIGGSDEPVTDRRYKVDLLVKVLKPEYRDMVFWRLKDGSSNVEGDENSRTTSVLVLNKDTFRRCLKWKLNETNKQWKQFLSMDSAVP